MFKIFFRYFPIKRTNSKCHTTITEKYRLYIAKKVHFNSREMQRFKRSSGKISISQFLWAPPNCYSVENYDPKQPGRCINCIQKSFDGRFGFYLKAGICLSNFGSHILENLQKSHYRFNILVDVELLHHKQKLICHSPKHLKFKEYSINFFNNGMSSNWEQFLLWKFIISIDIMCKIFYLSEQLKYLVPQIINTLSFCFWP